VAGLADEDLNQGAHGDVDEGAVAHYRVEQRAAATAVRIVGGGFAKNQEAVGAFDVVSFSRGMPAGG
jgi:hypothetical protein